MRGARDTCDGLVASTRRSTANIDDGYYRFTAYKDGKQFHIPGQKINTLVRAKTQVIDVIE